MSKFNELLSELRVDDDAYLLLSEAMAESSKSGKCSKILLSLGFYPSKRTSEIKAKTKITLSRPSNIKIEKEPSCFFYVNGRLVKDDQEQMNLDLGSDIQAQHEREAA